MAVMKIFHYAYMVSSEILNHLDWRVNAVIPELVTKTKPIYRHLFSYSELAAGEIIVHYKYETISYLGQKCSIGPRYAGQADGAHQLVWQTHNQLIIPHLGHTSQ